jgi:hypothetical protein
MAGFHSMAAGSVFWRRWFSSSYKSEANISRSRKTSTCPCVQCLQGLRTTPQRQNRHGKHRHYSDSSAYGIVRNAPEAEEPRKGGSKKIEIGEKRMSNLVGNSNDPKVPAVLGTNTDGGVALAGSTTGGPGGRGVNVKKTAVLGNADTNGVGVQGTSQNGSGVIGTSVSGVGVFAESQSGSALQGYSVTGTGVQGFSGHIVGGGPPTGDGVFGEGKNGVHGVSGMANGSGVFGENSGGDGVLGVGKNGVHGVGSSADGHGVFGENSGGDAVVGLCTSTGKHAGVSATNDSGGYGVWARGTPAGYFAGDVEVTGDIHARNVNVIEDVVLQNQDCAEDFDVADAATIEPGNVMVINYDGALRTSREPYDKKVAGVISGAGDFKPGIILGKQQQTETTRMPIALLGKVYCKVDADCSPIDVGDLLTTSPTPGHAMKVTDPLKALGCVIGKALQPLATGRGLIPILIALQ